LPDSKQGMRLLASPERLIEAIARRGFIKK